MEGSRQRWIIVGAQSGQPLTVVLMLSNGSMNIFGPSVKLNLKWTSMIETRRLTKYTHLKAKSKMAFLIYSRKLHIVERNALI
jgi:hypothetical protein